MRGCPVIQLSNDFLLQGPVFRHTLNQDKLLTSRDMEFFLSIDYCARVEKITSTTNQASWRIVSRASGWATFTSPQLNS